MEMAAGRLLRASFDPTALTGTVARLRLSRPCPRRPRPGRLLALEVINLVTISGLLRHRPPRGQESCEPLDFVVAVTAIVVNGTMMSP